MTVMSGKFGEGLSSMQVALFYGAKFKTLEQMQCGDVADNFEFVKVYVARCTGRNIMLKYKKGDLELQRWRRARPGARPGASLRRGLPACPRARQAERRADATPSR